MAPHRGGAVEEYTLFGDGINYADVLTRRREAYHEAALAAGRAAATREQEAGTPSIHDLERALRLEEAPPLDAEDRAMFVDRVLSEAVTLDAYAAGDYPVVRSWAGTALDAQVVQDGAALELICRPGAGERGGLLEKRLRFEEGGALSVTYRWEPTAFPAGSLFAPEISLAGGEGVDLAYTPAAELWSFPITTIAKSEQGLDETLQGQSYTPRWRVAAGESRVDVVAGGGSEREMT